LTETTLKFEQAISLTDGFQKLSGLFAFDTASFLRPVYQIS